MVLQFDWSNLLAYLRISDNSVETVHRDDTLVVKTTPVEDIRIQDTNVRNRSRSGVHTLQVLTNNQDLNWKEEDKVLEQSETPLEDKQIKYTNVRDGPKNIVHTLQVLTSYSDLNWEEEENIQMKVQQTVI